MRLSFFAASNVADVADLPNALDTRDHVWAFVEEDDGWFRPGEAIRIRKKRRDESGTIALSASSDDLVVDELLTEGAHFTLDEAPLTAITRAKDPRAFRAALRVLRPLARTRDQFETPSTRSALDAQRELYDAAEVVSDTRNCTGLSALEELLVEKWMPANGDVIDVGCGTGREAIAFAERGMRVTAVDVSEASALVARTRAMREFSADRVSVLTGDLATLDLPREAFDAVFFGSDVYACIPGRKNRERALSRATELLRPSGRVFVQAMIAPRRVRHELLDAACRVVARVRGEHRERGDRWIWRGPPPVRVFRHGFSGDEEVVCEIESAGLSFVARCGSYVIAEKRVRNEAGTSPRRSMLHETGAVLGALPRVDRIRRTYGPKPAITALRTGASNEPWRDARGRARLARAIELCDRIYPFGKGGCYRRALLEIALDSGAASETLYLGLADPEGHAWLARSWPADRYPAVFTV